ncbi:GMC oxidoreductase [Apiospora kogelbergensis]|uniref:GMC oxidoreductase n=1 Tax=Apiospora kogelbergensis TaxID=1337665 RepID=A0AAW0QU57_9PEZI
MAAHELSGPMPIPKPSPISGEELFTESQWSTLLALVDAAVPSIVVASSAGGSGRHIKISEQQYKEAYEHVRASLAAPPSSDEFEEYLRSRLCSSPRFVQNVKRTFQTVPASHRKRLAGALDLLETRLGSLISTGYFTPFSELSLANQQAVIQSWITSWSPLWPTLARIFLSLAQKSFGQSDILYQRLIGYTDYPHDYKSRPGFDFDFLQFEALQEPATIDTDVVIVGSGCGGAVCAKVLAEAGHQVLVVDKGYHFPPSRLPMDQENGCRHLFESHGVLSSEDSSTNILAGSCWGGGGTVNWSVSLEPEEFVRRDWADQGLPFFAHGDFQESLDRVQWFMGVSDDNIRHNHAAQVLLDGSRRLGWSARPTPLNTGGEDHYCGRCNLGCASTGKKGPVVSWLPAAAKAGAHFIEGFQASEVLFDGPPGSTEKVVGLTGTWTARDKDGNVTGSSRLQRDVRINAKKVIVAAGSLQSPLLLLRSGLRNPHIGNHLHLHPCNQVFGRFDEDIKPWEGGAITAVCDEHKNLDGNGHGVNLETTSMVPYMALSNLPWYSGLDFKLNALQLRNTNCFISLTRDRDTGRVFADPASGGPRVEYTPSDFDRAHALVGVLALAKLCYVQGAREIWANLPGVKPFVRSSNSPSSSFSSSTAGHVSAKEDDEELSGSISHVALPEGDPAFMTWLALLEKAGNKPPRAPWGSAHQMGSCRMSSREDTGVVDARGRVWGTEGLFVADSSVFPSASGVNPMVTVMAIADHIARNVAKDL